MCCLFLAVSQTAPLDEQRCSKALNASLSRGPDATYTYCGNKFFLGYNVLSITGTTYKDFNETNQYWFGFNGEIYNIPIKQGVTDTETLLHRIQQSNLESTLNDIDGMFGLILYDKRTNKIKLARDVQGEKTLYVYYDRDTFIVSSTLTSIESFLGKLEIDNYLFNSYLHTRHLLTYNKTIYKNTFQVKPGTIVDYCINTHTYTVKEFDSLYNYIDLSLIKENESKDLQTLTDELDILLESNISQMLSDKKTNISISGGIDSSLIAAYVAKLTDNYELVTTNCVGKDQISNNLNQFQQYFKKPIQTISISEQEWCNHLCTTYKVLRMPLPSHNYCTKLIQAQILQKQNIKVNFGGEVADELFGGYEFYKTLQTTNTNISPYSSCVNLSLSHEWNIAELNTYIGNVWQKAYALTNNSILATSFTDYYINAVDDGLRNGDQIFGWYGIENRSPFTRKKIVKFALNLPHYYKRGKPLLLNLFKKYFPDIAIQPKQGFAGFPNETKHVFSKPYERFSVLSHLNIKHFEYTKEVLWKLLNLEIFYECRNSRYVNVLT